MSQLFPYDGLNIPNVGTWVPLDSQIWDQAYHNLGAWVYFSYSVLHLTYSAVRLRINKTLCTVCGLYEAK